MTQAVRSSSPALETTVARAVGYSLLAHSFANPDESAIHAMQEAAAAAAPFLADSALGDLCRLAWEAEPEELLAAHTRLFTLSSSPDSPNFETAYFSSDPTQQTNRMADIAGFYRAFGVDTGGTGFRPDDISVELEFMGYLCRKEIYAGEHLGAPRVAQTKKAQRMFLAEHLGAWAGEFGRRVATRAGRSQFYQALGVALEDWMLAESALLGVEMAAPVNPVGGWPEPGELSNEPEGEDPQVFGLDEIPVL